MNNDNNFLHSAIQLPRKLAKQCKDRLPQNMHALAHLMSLYFLLALSISLPALSIQFQYVQRYDLGATSISIISGIVGSPWILKPIAASIGSKPFPFVCVFVSLLSALMVIPLPISALVIALFFRQLGIVYLDVCTDGFMVKNVEKTNSKGGTQAVIYAARSLGGMIGSLAGAVIYHFIHDRIAFVISSTCTIALLAIYSSNREQKTENAVTTTTDYGEIFKWIKTNILYIAFVVIYHMQPSVRGSCIYYMQTTLNINEMNFAVLSVLGALSTLLSGALYTWYGNKIPPRSLIATGIAFGSTITFVFSLYITSFSKENFRLQHFSFFAFTDIVDTFVGNFALMPIIVIATRLAKGNSMKYAIITSIMNIFGIFSEETGAMLTKSIFGSGHHITPKPLSSALFMSECFSLLTISGVMWLVPKTIPEV